MGELEKWGWMLGVSGREGGNGPCAGQGRATTMMGCLAKGVGSRRGTAPLKTNRTNRSAKGRGQSMSHLRGDQSHKPFPLFPMCPRPDGRATSQPSPVVGEQHRGRGEVELSRTGLLVPEGCQRAYQVLWPKERWPREHHSAPNPRVVARRRGLYTNRSVPTWNFSKSGRSRETDSWGFPELFVLPCFQRIAK